MLEIDLIQPERHELADAQTVAEGEKDHGRVAVAMATELARGGHELLDLGWRQVLASTSLSIWASTGRGSDFPERSRESYPRGLRVEWWRRGESNPGPRTFSDRYYVRILRSLSRPRCPQAGSPAS
jgi:hypothetical protein